MFAIYCYVKFYFSSRNDFIVFPMTLKSRYKFISADFLFASYHGLFFLHQQSRTNNARFLNPRLDVVVAPNTEFRTSAMMYVHALVPEF
jgi:hypothetical protein